MIAWAIENKIQRCKKKLFHKKNETVKRSRWPLDVKAPFLKVQNLKF